MRELNEIPIGEIVVGGRKRTLDPAKVVELAESIRESGLLQPILLTHEKRLVHGHHRLEAARLLSWETISAMLEEMSELEAELAEIDENLYRSELSVLERAELLLRRDEILRLKGIRAQAGDNQHPGGGELISPPKTTLDLAGEIGLGERSAQMYLQIARDIFPEVRDVLRETDFANKTTELLALARIKDKDAQKKVAERVLSGECFSVTSAARALNMEERRGVEVGDAIRRGRSPEVKILVGGALEVLKTLPDESVHCVVTSPPYWGLRDYGFQGQLGLEPTPEEYVEKIVAIFREVRRVLRKDGTLWLNLGDTYAAHSHGQGGEGKESTKRGSVAVTGTKSAAIPPGLKPKDLVGIPWRVAFALQTAGWCLRSDMIWFKKNPLPESVQDRPSKAHEYIFLLAKRAQYFYDAHAVKELTVSEPETREKNSEGYNQALGDGRDKFSPGLRTFGLDGFRNLRSVWSIAMEPFPSAHFATFPTKLVEPCIKAGTSEAGCCPHCGAPWERVTENVNPHAVTTGRTRVQAEQQAGEGRLSIQRPTAATQKQFAVWATIGWRPSCTCESADPVPCTVLDPFIGSGTTGLVAHQLDRSCIGIELNPKYADMARKRIFGSGSSGESQELGGSP